MALCHERSAEGWTEVEDLDDLSELRKQSGNLLWAEADVQNLTPDDIATVAEEFGLHPLAVEDAMSLRQRPKIEAYDDHLFLVIHQLDERERHMEACQLACFIGDRYIVTIHHGAQRTIEEAKGRWAKGGVPGSEGPAQLVHTLLDVLVDEYQKHADHLEQEMEELEEVALATPTAPIQRQLYSVKQRIARMRRYALPVTRVLDAFVSADSGKGILPDVEEPHFRDIKDHTIRIGEQIRSIDDLSQAVLDLARSEQAAALNENSRKLSAWAAIFAVATLVAGVYGMNFRLVPEENTLFGFWFAVALMVVICGSLYGYFKRRGWL
jgi:magnesium transporter